MAPSHQRLAVIRVLRHPAMFRLWLAQVIYLSVQFTASYGMIVLITEETHSATLVGVVLITLSLPIVLLGAPAGTLVDHFNRRTVLWVSNVVRAIVTAGFVLALLIVPHAATPIFVLAFLFSLVGLFFTPAEAALIPLLVDEDELLPALSLYNLTLNISQAVGLLIFGPLALNLLPTLVIGRAIITPIVLLFAGVSALYLVAALLTSRLPLTKPEAASVSALPVAAALPRLSLGAAWQRMRGDLWASWQIVRHDSILAESLFQACFGSLIMLTVAQLATTFVQFVHLPIRDTALIFAPAGAGLILGGVIVPVVVGRLGSTRTMVVGMAGAALGLGLLPLAQVLEPPQLSSTLPFLLVVVLLMFVAGLCLDLIIVPAQTQVQEHSPDAMRGRIQGFYQVLFNGGSIPVVLFVGALTDLLGIVPVLIVLAGTNLVAIVLTLLNAAHRTPQSAGAPDNAGATRTHEASVPQPR